MISFWDLWQSVWLAPCWRWPASATQTTTGIPATITTPDKIEMRFGNNRCRGDRLLAYRANVDDCAEFEGEILVAN